MTPTEILEAIVRAVCSASREQEWQRHCERIERDGGTVGSGIWEDCWYCPAYDRCDNDEVPF